MDISECLNTGWFINESVRVPMLNTWSISSDGEALFVHVGPGRVPRGGVLVPIVILIPPSRTAPAAVLIPSSRTTPAAICRVLLVEQGPGLQVLVVGMCGCRGGSRRGVLRVCIPGAGFGIAWTHITIAVPVLRVGLWVAECPRCRLTCVCRPGSGRPPCITRCCRCECIIWSPWPAR